MYGNSSQMFISSFLTIVTLVQIALILWICKIKFDIILLGIKWGDLQQKSRISEYFLATQLVAVPLLIGLCVFELNQAVVLFEPIPELQMETLSSFIYLSMNVVFACLAALTIFSYICVMLQSNEGLDYYMKASVTTSAVLVLFTIVLLFKLSFMTGVIYDKDTIYDRNWPQLMQAIHLQEFGLEGISPCQGGKYRKDVTIQNDVSSVSCSAIAQKYGFKKSSQLVSQLWEFQ